jgi:hypothetical protein
VGLYFALRGRSAALGPGSGQRNLTEDQRQRVRDRVTVASDDSFPASDPPAWTGAHSS